MDANVDVEQFISEIKQHPSIWDSNCEEYSDKLFRRREWQVVAHQFCPEFDNKTRAEKIATLISFQKKWKSLRTCYTRELSRMRKEKCGLVGKKKKYIYFDQLNFLQSATKYSCTGNEDEEHEDDVDEEEVVDSQSVAEDADSNQQRQQISSSRLPAKRSRIVADDEESPCSKHLKPLPTEELDEDRLFFLSLVPEMKKLPEAVRMDVKAEIYNVIRKARKEQSIPNANFQIPASTANRLSVNHPHGVHITVPISMSVVSPNHIDIPPPPLQMTSQARKTSASTQSTPNLQQPRSQAININQHFVEVDSIKVELSSSEDISNSDANII